jgi:hypothetical protein
MMSVHGGTIIVAWAAGEFSIHGVVVMGASKAPVPRLLGEGRPKPLSPLNAVRNSSAKSSIMENHIDEAPQWVDPLEAQTAEIVGDELKVPKANGFIEGKSTAWQMFTINSDGDHRWRNHRNI